MTVEELQKLASEKASEPMTLDEFREERDWLWKTLYALRNTVAKYKSRLLECELELSVCRGEPQECAQRRVGEFVFNELTIPSLRNMKPDQ